jgi:hypothetical protein
VSEVWVGSARGSRIREEERNESSSDVGERGDSGWFAVAHCKSDVIFKDRVSGKPMTEIIEAAPYNVGMITWGRIPAHTCYRIIGRSLTGRTQKVSAHYYAD